MYLERFPWQQDKGKVFTFTIIPPLSLPGTLQGLLSSQYSAWHPLLFHVARCLEKQALPPPVAPSGTGWKATGPPPQRETVFLPAPFWPSASFHSWVAVSDSDQFMSGNLKYPHQLFTSNQDNSEIFHTQNPSRCGFFLLPSLENCARWNWYLFMIYLSTQELFF